MDDKIDSFLSMVPEEPPVPQEGLGEDIQSIVLHPGMHLGHYEVISFLAEGGMGMVYLAKHRELSSKHAIKIIRKTFASRKEFIERFRHEARIMAALDHPNIVRVTDFGEEAGRYYYVMNYVEGPGGKPRTLQDDFEEALKKPGIKKGLLPERKAKEIALQICAALAYAHHFKDGAVAHLDLKPSNIMIVGESSATVGARTLVKVTDFGFARMVSRDSVYRSRLQSDTSRADEKAAAIAGTPRYMSPEQWEGEKKTGPASDIYSLGIILYEALVGKVPQEIYPPPTPSSCGCAEGWDRIIKRCLQNSPEKRYKSVVKLASDIRRVRFHKTRPRRLKRVAVLLSVAAVLAMVRAAMIQVGIIDQKTVDEGHRLIREYYVTAKEAVLASLKPIGYLSIQSDPDVSLVAIDANGKRKKLGVTDPFGRKIAIRIPEGKYDLELSHVGCETAVESIEINRGEVLMVERKLAQMNTDQDLPRRVMKRRLGDQSKMGQIRILCNVTDADVYANDEYIGKVGETLFLPAYSKQHLQIRAAGYNPEQMTVSISAAGQSREDYSVKLTSAPGRLRIVCDAEGAAVYREEIRLGAVGDILPFPVGEKQVIDIAAPGYKTKRLAIELKKGGEVQDYTVQLYPKACNLRVIADAPPGYRGSVSAEVLIDGKSLGTKALPFTWQDLPAGQHEISIAGRPWKAGLAETVILKNGQTTEVRFDLQVVNSVLQFEITPANAVVYLDGRRVEGYSFQVDPDVAHDIRIWAKGYDPFTDQISVPFGETNAVRVQLKKKGRGLW